mmetsp:Transcript_58902/g.149225  ORF Transcript_58902/g.149225 Transcript_58902/m.149225 type:complete len:208 (-) Transcript_58902:1878-2501(-)
MREGHELPASDAVRVGVGFCAPAVDNWNEDGLLAMLLVGCRRRHQELLLTQVGKPVDHHQSSPMNRPDLRRCRQHRSRGERTTSQGGAAVVPRIGELGAPRCHAREAELLVRELDELVEGEAAGPGLRAEGLRDGAEDLPSKDHALLPHLQSVLRRWNCVQLLDGALHLPHCGGRRSQKIRSNILCECLDKPEDRCHKRLRTGVLQH